MNDEIQKENRPALDRNAFLAEIERLYVEGYPTREIAQLLHEDGNKVGRNLRELKRRWARAAQRQRAALSQTQCAAVYREAMSGWRCSQLPKITTTEHRDADGKPVKTTIRRQEGPGDKTFLLAAASALKTLRQFAQPQAGSSSDKDRDVGDPVYLAILETLTQEQVDNLTHEQLQRIHLAVDRFQAEVDRFHAEVEAFRREKAPDRHDGQPGSPTANDAALPSEPAPQDPGEDSGPNGVEAASRRLNNAAGRRIDGLGEALPPADDLQAAAAPQEQAGESPLLAAHAEQQSEPAGLPAQEETALPPVVEQDVPADSPAAEERQEQAETSDVGGPAQASSPDGAAPDERRSPVHVGGPRTVPPTAAEHEAYRQWLAQQYAIARHNLLLTQGLQLTPSGAPPAANLTEGASHARRMAWTEAMSR